MSTAQTGGVRQAGPGSATASVLVLLMQSEDIAACSKVLSSSLQKLFYGNKDFTLPNLASIHSLGNSAERIFRYIYDVLVAYSSSFIAGFYDK